MRERPCLTVISAELPLYGSSAPSLGGVVHEKEAQMAAFIGVAIAFVVILIFSNPKTRNCRWRAEHHSDTEGQAAWHCITCGARTLTKDRKPPVECPPNSTDT